jgi:hypothetical protein
MLQNRPGAEWTRRWAGAVRDGTNLQSTLRDNGAALRRQWSGRQGTADGWIGWIGARAQWCVASANATPANGDEPHPGADPILHHAASRRC